MQEFPVDYDRLYIETVCNRFPDVIWDNLRYLKQLKTHVFACLFVQVEEPTSMVSGGMAMAGGAAAGGGLAFMMCALSLESNYSAKTLA